MVYVAVNVNEKGQIVIPKVFRDSFGIRPGESVLVGEKNDSLVIERRMTRAEFAKALQDFPKWKNVKVDSDKDYEEEMLAR